MNGARDFYNIIHKAYDRELGSLRKLNIKYGWSGGDSKAFINGNFIFVTSSHARGNCFRIFLIEDNQLPDHLLQTNAFEVYGIISGNPGWTENYGWKYKGTWTKLILKYLLDLEKEIIQYDNKKLEEKRLIEKENNKIIEMKIDKLNRLFI